MKRYIQFSLIFLGLSLVAFMGCREDELIDEGPTTQVPTEEPGEFFSTELNGVVIDESGLLVSDATIIVSGETVTTNEFGFFTLRNLEAPNTGLYVKVLKDGYFTGGTHYFPSEPTATTVEITLLKKDIRSFEASIGYEEQLPSGATVMIPASSIHRNGQVYSGTVNISTVWLNPEDEATFDNMPGALVAQNEIGETQYLQTFGMIAVEMTDDTGQELQLIDGRLAELSFPLSPSIEGEAPATIPLWHFNETTGIWVEEGQAVKSNGRYAAQVSHFTWWNCDVPFDISRLCLIIEDQRGNAIENLTACLSNGTLTLCLSLIHI